MGWGPDFVSALSGSDGVLTPFFVVEAVPIPEGAAAAFGADLKLSSFQTPGYQAIIQIDGSSVSYGELQARAWKASSMSWSIGLAGDHAAGVVRADARRGQPVQLRVGFSRDLSTFETVAVGTVFNVERRGGRWSLVIKDLAGSLVSRISDTSVGGSLFFDLASTALTSGYTPGDGSVSVGTTVGFRTDGGGIGVVRITPTTGDPFFLSYTGTTASTFTGLSASGRFGTTAVAAVSTDEVSEVAYIVDHPIAILRRILVSTGTATNSTHDDLPESWGYGIPASHVALDDMTSFIQDTNPAGSDNQEMISDVAQGNPKSFLDSWLSGAGYFLTTHQGQITCRAALDPKDQRTPGHIEIGDHDIAEIEEYQAFDRNSPVEYRSSKVVPASGAGFNSLDTFVQSLPVAEVLEHPLPGLYSTNANFSAIRAEHADRLKIWDFKIPERIVLRLANWRGAIPSPGDTVSFTTSLIVDREGHPFSGRRGMVIQSGARWFGATSRVSILFLPTALVAQPAP